MHLFKRLFRNRQKEISPDALARNIHYFSRMIPPQLWRKRRGMLETIHAAESNNMEIVPNNEVAQLIKAKRHDPNVGFVWTGTLVLFEEAGMPFKDIIESTLGMVEAQSIRFETSSWHRGLEGGCLAVNHPLFRLHRIHGNGLELQVPHEALQYIRDFPVREGSFPCEGFFGLPVDTEGGKDVHMILRPRSHIGLVARSLLDPLMLFTTELPAEEMAVFVRPAINQANYLDEVARVVGNGADMGMLNLVRQWATEDPNLARKIGKM